MREVASLYCGEREVSADYRQALHRVAASMQAAGVTPLTISDSSINQWLAGLRQSQTTRANYRRMALTLWRYAVDVGLAAHRIGRVVKIKPRILPPVAWSMSELSSLLHHARLLQYRFKRSRCPASVFFEAWVRAGFETGLRFSDLLALRCDQLRGNRLFVTPNKTGRPIGKVLSGPCLKCLTHLSVLGDGKTFFAWAIAERRLRIYFSRLCQDAGLHGTPKFLRRSGATYCEKKQPGSAKLFLGHLSDGLAQKHYVDPTLIEDACPTPMPLPTDPKKSRKDLPAFDEPSCSPQERTGTQTVWPTCDPAP